MQKTNLDAVNAALTHMDYLNMIVVSAAAAPARLPVIVANPEIDSSGLQQHLGALVCVVQEHFAALSKALQTGDIDLRVSFTSRTLITDTINRLKTGEAPVKVIHRHIRNLFAFDDVVYSDQAGECGVYTRHDEQPYQLGVIWLLDVLTGIETGRSLDKILGEAQNTDICTRLCFGDAVKLLETWRRDLQLILPPNATRM